MSNPMKNGGANIQNFSKKQPISMDDKKGSFGGNQKLNRRNEDDKATSNRKIFIGGLTSNTTKDHLTEYFSKYGGVEDANIKMDPNTGRSRGYGFVLFETKEIADQVLSVKEHVIAGKTVDVKTAKYKGAPPVKKIFIGGLDPSFPEAELREYFSKYGKIEEIELPFDKQKNQRKSFCFILFETEDTVNEILKKPKHILGGKEVDVKKATPLKDQNQQNALMQPQWNQYQNWNVPNNFFPSDPSAQAYGASNFGGIYNAPANYTGQAGTYSSQNPGYTSGYVDYDNVSSYEYASSNNVPAPGYDQSFYQNNQVNSSYDGYYEGGFYNNYPPTNDQFSQPVNPPKTHHGYGKMSKRSSQSQSYHPYNR